jgi:hypothetical protein
MRRRFVIAVDDLDKEQRRQVTDIFRGKGAWWHWIDNFWLFKTTDPAITTETLRDELHDISPDSNLIVFEFPEDITWSGHGPAGNQKNMFKWLHDTWDKE